MADEYGTIVNVATTNVGEFLTADVATGSAVLPVSDASTFDETGGQLLLNGVVYRYTTIDLDQNVVILQTGGGLLLTLGSGVSAPALADDRVEIYPARPEKKALVDFGVEEGEAVYAIVPHDLTAVIPDGFREEGFREPVLVEERRIGELYVKDLAATKPDLTESVEVQLGDGSVPIASPTPVVMGWVGALHVKWAAIISSDVVTYDVHISTVNDFTPDSSTLVGSTAGTTFTIRSLPNDLLLAYSTTYYVKIIARDYDGPAPAGSQGSDQLQPITGPDIAASFVYAGTVYASQIEGGDISADLTLSGSIKTALSGGRTEIIGNAINIYDPTGQPGIVLAPESSVFRGDAEIGGLTVKNAMSIRGTANELSTGGELLLAAGITAPSTPPSIVQDWESITFTKAGDASFNPANLTSVQWNSSLWICGYRDGSYYKVYRFNSDGTFNSLACDDVLSSTALQTTQIGVGGYCYTIASNNTIYRHRKLTDTWTLQDDFTSAINGATWIDNTGATWDSGSGGRAKLVDDSHMMTDNVFDMKSSTIQAKITRTAGTTGQDIFFTARHGSGEEMAQIKLEGSSLTFRVGSSPFDGTWDFESSITYSATNHAYWKIWEEDTVGGGGNFHFATSPTGLFGSWTERAVFDHDYTVTEMGVVEIRFTGQDAGLTFYVDEFKYGPSNEGISSDPYDTQNSGVEAMTLGNDGTNLLLAEHDNTGGDDRIRVRLITPPAWDVVSTFNSVTDSAYDGPLSGIAVGNFDFGSGRYVTKRATSGADFRVFNSSTGARVSGEEFPPATSAPKSFTWDGSFFWELAPNGTLYKHTAATLAGAYLAGFTWYDSAGTTHETPVSPLSSFTLKRRARITLTAAAIPGAGGVDDPNSVRFYVGTSSGALKLQSTTGAGVNSAIYQAITTGGAAPPASNNFTAGVAAKIKSASGGLVIDGAGNVDTNNLDVAGILTARNRIVGRVLITPSAADVPTSITVTFPQALLGTNFMGLVSAETSVPGQPASPSVRGVGIDQITSTTCRIWVTRSNTTATGVFYMVEGY